MLSWANFISNINFMIFADCILISGQCKDDVLRLKLTFGMANHGQYSSTDMDVRLVLITV